VGQSILINNLPFTIIGVAERKFFGADPDQPPDVYVPLHATLFTDSNHLREEHDELTDPDYDWIIPMARLRPGVTALQAQSAAAGSFQEFERTAEPGLKSAEIPKLVVRAGAAGLDSLRRKYSKPLYILLALVGLILAIACANIANLLLARAAARRREIAVRLSIGAGRGRVIRQLLTESVLLAAIGGALGAVFAVWGIRFLTMLLAAGREGYTLRADLNWHVLALVAGLSLATGVLFGLAPALHSTRLDLMSVVKESRTGDERRQSLFSLSRVLIVAQIAITLLIVISAGLFARTLSNLGSIQLGFNADNLLTFELNARQAGQKDPGIVNFYSNLQRQFSEIPGVHSATLADNTLIGTGTSATFVGPDGLKPRVARILTIGTDFFHTMQVPILLGRDIQETDATGSPMVAIVNQQFAKMRFGDKNPLGQHITLPRSCPKCDIEIVGVSGNSLYGNLKGKIEPTVYLPFAQGAWGPVNEMYFSLRTAGNPLSYVHTVREIVHSADERVPLTDVKTQRAWIDETINQEITFARLCGAFAILALAIACVGLYGTMSYNVARRTGEIGIRMALGAQRRRVVMMILREVFILLAVGLAISLPAALLMSKIVKSFLYAMKPNDPVALCASIVILAIASILAGFIPARRASEIDPIQALRHE
jgi:macrolide transport system ATP-binding/permease protein